MTVGAPLPLPGPGRAGGEGSLGGPRGLATPASTEESGRDFASALLALLAPAGLEVRAAKASGRGTARLDEPDDDALAADEPTGEEAAGVAAAPADLLAPRGDDPPAARTATDATAPVAASAADAADRDLARVHPELVRRVERVVERMAEEHGHDVQVVEGFRDQARQERLYAQGRARPGPIVTWTRASEHTLGRAVDVQVDRSWHAPEAYARLQRIAREEGLATLGARDPGHLELPDDVGPDPRGPRAVAAFRSLVGDPLASPGLRSTSPSPARPVPWTASPLGGSPLAAGPAAASEPAPAASATVAVAPAPTIPAQAVPPLPVPSGARRGRHGVAAVADVASVARPARVARVARPGSSDTRLDPDALVTSRVSNARGGDPGARGAQASAQAPAQTPPQTPAQAPARAPAEAPGPVPVQPPPVRAPVAADAGTDGASPDARRERDRRTASSRGADLSARAGEPGYDGGAAHRASGAPALGERAMPLATGATDPMQRALEVKQLQEALREQGGAALRLDLPDVDGEGTRLRLGLRGGRLDATLELRDTETAQRIRARVDELYRTLERRGVETEILRVRTVDVANDIRPIAGRTPAAEAAQPRAGGDPDSRPDSRDPAWTDSGRRERGRSHEDPRKENRK